MKKKNISLQRLALNKETIAKLSNDASMQVKGGDTNTLVLTCNETNPHLCYVKTTPEYTCVNSANCPPSAPPTPCSQTIFPPGETGC